MRSSFGSSLYLHCFQTKIKFDFKRLFDTFALGIPCRDFCQGRLLFVTFTVIPLIPGDHIVCTSGPLTFAFTNIVFFLHHRICSLLPRFQYKCFKKNLHKKYILDTSHSCIFFAHIIYRRYPQTLHCSTWMVWMVSSYWSPLKPLFSRLTHGRSSSLFPLQR